MTGPPVCGLSEHRPGNLVRNFTDNCSIEFLRIRNSQVTGPRGGNSPIHSPQGLGEWVCVLGGW